MLKLHFCIPIGIVATLATLTLIPLVTSPFINRFCTTGLAICSHKQHNNSGKKEPCVGLQLYHVLDGSVLQLFLLYTQVVNMPALK